MPAAVGKDTKVPPTYTSEFGAKGTGTGELESPSYDALDAHGDVWVQRLREQPDLGVLRVGAFIETLGWGVSNGEAKLEVCASGCKAGIAGRGKAVLRPHRQRHRGRDIWVVDTGNNRIEVLNEKGEYASKGAPGAQQGQFNDAAGDRGRARSGNVWVGDWINRRLQEFTESGEFVEAFGFGVSNGESEYEICKSSCQAGINGQATGSSRAGGYAFSAAAHLYVADTGNNRVEEFNEKGEYAGQFGTSRHRQRPVRSPERDRGQTDHRQRVRHRHGQRPRGGVHRRTGNYLTQFGSAGAGTGQLEYPEGVASTHHGDIYVADDSTTASRSGCRRSPATKARTTPRPIYYTAEANSRIPRMRQPPRMGRPAMRDGTPAAQPGTERLPKLPSQRHTRTTSGTSPKRRQKPSASTKRTKTETYDAAGRLKSSASTSPPAPRYPRSPTNTAARNRRPRKAEHDRRKAKPRRSRASTTRSASSTSYTDADENTTTYEYDIRRARHKDQRRQGHRRPTPTTKQPGCSTELVRLIARRHEIHRQPTTPKATCSTKATPTA